MGCYYLFHVTRLLLTKKFVNHRSRFDSRLTVDESRVTRCITARNLLPNVQLQKLLIFFTYNICIEVIILTPELSSW